MSRPGTGAAVLLCSVVALAACQQPAAEAGAMRCGPDPAVAALLGETMQRHVQAHLAQDAEAAASDYTDDVWFRMDGGVELRGRQTMVDLYTEMYRTTRLVSFEGEDDETLVCADAAHVVGGYTEVTETDGVQTTSRYQYMLLWRLQPDGSWKVSRGTMVTVPEAT
jgi:uncharacterized protein (TIGR02246 family)